MPLLEWTSDFSVNIADFDAEHKKMFEMINELHDAFHQGHSNESLPEIMRMMNGYTIFHFLSEERLLRKVDYPGLEKQKKEHNYFIERLKGFEKDFENTKLGLSNDVLSFLKDWWTKHVQFEDKKYGPFLNEKGYH